jgi:S-DNA-T family DNA segregation ATPase FtsK/SpoIIIE
VTPSDLIGAAGATSIRLRLEALTPDDELARYLLDRLTGEQVAAITRALLADPVTANKLMIALPRDLVAPFGLPEMVITDERTVRVRNSACDRPAMLLANTDDDQGASLGDVTLIGAKQLTEESGPWVDAAAAGLGLSEGQIDGWKAALKGLNSADDWTLHQIGTFVAMTRERINTEAVPVAAALGWALPALRLPRDSGYFMGLGDKDREQPRRWKKLFEKLVSDRKPLLVKQRPNRQIIESEECDCAASSTKFAMTSRPKFMRRSTRLSTLHRAGALRPQRWRASNGKDRAFSSSSRASSSRRHRSPRKRSTSSISCCRTG